MPRSSLRSARSEADRARAESVAHLCEDLDLLEEKGRQYLQTMPDDVLAAAVKSLLDFNVLARRELAARGLDTDAQWIGFDEAKKLHKVR
jgi:hypothetical protein